MMQILREKQKVFLQTKEQDSGSQDDDMLIARKNVFIQRMLKLSIDEHLFDEAEVANELRTMMIAVWLLLSNENCMAINAFYIDIF